MFFGHTAAITSLTSGSLHKPYIVSSSDNGYVVFSYIKIFLLKIFIFQNLKMCLNNIFDSVISDQWYYFKVEPHLAIE